MSGSGWECPRCGEVYGPHVEKCTNPDCKKAPRVTKQAGDLGDPISGDDLHDQLYRPSIHFPEGPPRKRRGGGPDESDGSSGVF